MYLEHLKHGPTKIHKHLYITNVVHIYYNSLLLQCKVYFLLQYSTCISINLCNGKYEFKKKYSSLEFSMH